MVLRGYMVDFIHLLAPHYPVREIRDTANLQSQEEVNQLLGDIALPVRGGCEKEAGAAATGTA
jgi:hypothetical protein